MSCKFSFLDNFYLDYELEQDLCGPRGLYRFVKYILRFIDDHNTQILSFKPNLNRFADLTDEEYRSKYPLVVDKQPRYIPTGKLIELLNKKRRSLCKKLGNEKMETMDQKLYEDFVPHNTRSNRRILVIDDSPQFKKYVAPKSSLTTNTRRSLQTSFEASSPENIVSSQPK
ncbi:hypothetical protein PanWU01x14_187150, partial [Parasponia andersonii]